MSEVELNTTGVLPSSQEVIGTSQDIWHEGNPAAISCKGGKKRKTKGKKVKRGKKTVRKTKSKGKKLSKTLSKWIMHVKNFAKQHKIKYPEAMKHPKCKATFKKQ